MNPEWRSRYNLASEAARAAGAHALHFYNSVKFGQQLEIITKADESPVTVADRGAEKIIRDMISRYFPHDGFLGEEFGDQPGTSGYRWIIDPIDGTKAFIRQVPLWGTLLALEYQGEQIAGHTYIPVFNQMYRALRGDGAYFDEARMHVSQVSTLDKASLSYSSLSWFRQVGKERQFLDLYYSTARQRGFGDFYGFMLVAQGAVDIMIDHGVHIWDVAGLRVIIEEAGGKFTDWQGNSTVSTPDCIATNGILHDVVLKFLQ
jgi:histidinol-phosphatase